MNIRQLIKNIVPFVKPYKWLILVTLLLTLAGSFMAQVNAIVLDKTVDSINKLVGMENFDWAKAAKILTIISVVLLSKEILSALTTFAQNYFGERMRIFVSRDLAQSAIEKILTFRMAFFSAIENDTGKLQTRIDQGVSSLSRSVQNFFIDIHQCYSGTNTHVCCQCLCWTCGVRYCPRIFLYHLPSGTTSQRVETRYEIFP